MSLPLDHPHIKHVSLATTDIYLRHIAPADVIAMGRKREWSP